MAPQAQPLLTALPEHFAASRQSCYLYAASELVKTFGGDVTYEQALGASCYQFSASALETTALPDHFAARCQSCYLYATLQLGGIFDGDATYEQALGS